MEIGETTIGVGESPILGSPIVSLFQPRPPKLKAVESTINLASIYEELISIKSLLRQIELNTRPLPKRSLWERIKSWLGMLETAAT